MTLDEQAAEALNDEPPDEPRTIGASVWLPAESDRFTWTELTEPPPPTRFVLHPYLPEGVPVILTGAGGTSKTGLAVGLIAVAVAAGVELFGETPEPGKVLIVSAEDRRDTLRRHLFANTQHLSDSARHRARANVYAKDVVGRGFKLTRHIDRQTEVAIDVALLTDYAAEVGPFRLIVLDTLSRLNGAGENNEDLARFVESMERISVETGATTLALHHAGKAQTREQVTDQYAGRGGSALSDNCRAAMHVATVTPEAKDAPRNAGDIIAEARLLRLAHVKHNLSAKAPDRYLERIPTPHAARLVPFAAEFGMAGVEGTWSRVETWLRDQRDVPFPTRATIEALGPEVGSRAEVRRAVQWATDRGRLIEYPHPDPKGGRKTYLAVPPSDADSYKKASRGE